MSDAPSSGIGSFLTLFDPTPIYDAGEKIAMVVYATATPTLLIVAIFIRTMETQADVLVGQGRWTHAIRDFLFYSFVVTAYFGLANLISGFMNPFYSWIDSFGSMQSIGQQMSEFLGTLKDKAGAQANAQGLLPTIVDSLTAAPTVVVSLLFYYLSLLIVAVLDSFLKIAHAIGYSVAVIYGLIAIPLSITRSLRLLRGWAMFLGFLLLWPVVQGICIGLFSEVFNRAAQSLVSDPSINVGVTAYGGYMFYTVLNLLLCAVLIAAPFVASSLTSNAPAGAALLTPFVTSAVAAGAALARTTSSGQKAGGIGGSMVSAAARAAGGGNARAGGPPGSRAPASAAATPGPAAMAVQAAPATRAADEATPPGGATPSDPDAARARQQRRGAIINQQKQPRKSKT
jgi:hypothetical protein